jgi:C4-type Zn-finger protein
MKDKLFGTFEDATNKAMLKYQADHQMFCPSCQGVLDWHRAVSIDFTRLSDDKLVFTTMFCAKCYDGKAKANIDHARTQGSKHFGEELTVKVTDGRTW